MAVTREEMVIAFGVDQTQLDNVMRVMPVKFSGAAKKSVDAFESQFRSLGERLKGTLTDSFIGGFTGAAVGGKIAGVITSLFSSIGQKASESMVRSAETVRGTLRTGMDSNEFQRGNNLFNKTVGGGFEGALDNVAEKVAGAMAGGETGQKLIDSMVELGAQFDTIQSGNYQQVFRQIAEYMKTAELSAQKIAALKEIFGRNGPELSLAFRQGMDSLPANAGIVNQEEINSNKASQKIDDQSAFTWGDLSSSGFGFLGKAFKGVFKGFGVAAGDMLARLLPGAGGVLPELAKNNVADEDVELIHQKDIAREKAKAEAAAKKEAAEKKAKEEKKKNDQLDKEADELNAQVGEKMFQAAQKQLKLEEQIAEAKRLQAVFAEKAAAINKKAFQDITAQDRKDAAEAALEAAKKADEAAQKEKELAEHKKQFQEQADDLQRRVEKAEKEVARTYAERYGFSIAELSNQDGSGMDLISGTRGHRGRRNRRRALNSRSAEEQYDFETSREIEDERAWAKTMLKYGQYEEAQAANMRADELANTLNFVKPSEADWQRVSQEALIESRDALERLLSKAEGDGIHIIPKMGK